MSRQIIPYQPIDLAEPKDIVDAVRHRRGGTLINLDRMLLHSAPFAKGWNSFLKEVRENLSLEPKLKEIAMCGVAILNEAEYEFFHHAPEFVKAGGSQAQVDELRKINTPRFNKQLFSALESDAIALTIQMTKSIKVDSDLLERLQKTLGNQATVELIGVIATYNMVSRFLIALGVTPESH